MISLCSQSEGTRLQKDLRTYLASVKGKVGTSRGLLPSNAFLHSEVSAAFPSLVFPQAWVAGQVSYVWGGYFRILWGQLGWNGVVLWCQTCDAVLADEPSHAFLGEDKHKGLDATAPLFPFSLCWPSISVSSRVRYLVSICCNAPVPPFLRIRIKLWGAHYFILSEQFPLLS